MYSPASFGVALLFTILSAVCWGSWPNTYRTTRRYPFVLYYWDYSLSAVAFTLLFALTLGSSGGQGESFRANLASADSINIFFALVSGAILNVANIFLIAGMDLTGLAVAFPVTLGIAMVEGTALSYAVQPKGSISYLFTGMALAVAAIVFDGFAYARRGVAGPPVSKRGLTVNVIAGLLLGAYSPFSTRALTNGHALTPYAITVLFAAGVLICSLSVNVWFMHHPLAGPPAEFSSFRTAGLRNHLLGILGGSIWAIGTTANFVAAGYVGVPISYSIGQSAPMIAALWGIFLWKEFAGAPTAAWRYLFLMFAFYVAGAVMIALAREV